MAVTRQAAQQRICFTPGCERLLSPGAAGNRCRACYESQSFAAQQRLVNGVTAQRDREKVTTVARERVTITAREGSTKTVVLDGGGQVTVNLVVDPFLWTARDRELVLGLVDALNAFERGLPPPSFHHCACEHYQKAAETCIEMSDGTEMCMVCGQDVGKPHKHGCAQGVLEAAGVAQ